MSAEARDVARPADHVRPGRRRILGRCRLGVSVEGRGRHARRARTCGHRGVGDDGALGGPRRRIARARARTRRSPSRRRSHELEVPGFADNPTHRCALCKTELMTVAAPIAAALGTRRHPRYQCRRPRRRPTRHRRGPCAGRVHADGRCRPRETEIPPLSKQLACRPGTSRSSRVCRRGFPYGNADHAGPTASRRRIRGWPARARVSSATRAVPRHGGAARGRDRRAATSDRSSREVVALGKRLGFAYVALDLAGFSLRLAQRGARAARFEAVKMLLVVVATMSLTASAEPAKKDRELAEKTRNHPAPPAPGTSRSR